MQDQDPTPTPPRFEDLMEFPARVRLRALGDAHEEITSRCAAAVIAVRPDGLVEVDVVASKRGNFVSVRVHVEAWHADELRAYYQALHAVDGVRVVF